MNANPANHWHKELKKSINATNKTHFYASHFRFGKSVYNGQRKSVHSKSDSKEKAVDDEVKIYYH